jgi:aspartate/methionine/tyrosine aminotransferase
MALQLNERIDRFESPFRRLDALIADLKPSPAHAPILMHVGEPQDSPPPLLAQTVAAHAHEWNRYPPSLGSPEFLAAVAGYIDRRYPAARARVRPAQRSRRSPAPARPCTWRPRWR